VWTIWYIWYSGGYITVFWYGLGRLEIIERYAYVKYMFVILICVWGYLWFWGLGYIWVVYVSGWCCIWLIWSFGRLVEGVNMGIPIIAGFGGYFTWLEWRGFTGLRLEIGKNRSHFYGMELPRVGAFTGKWGSGYRNPVQILGEKWKNHVFLGFWGLV